MIFITVIAVNFLGDGLRDAFDPQSERLIADDRRRRSEPSPTSGPDRREVRPSRRRSASRSTSSEVEDPNAPLLEVRDLSVEFKTDDGIVKAVQNVSYTLRERETLGIVGESGSGKTVTSMAILGLLPKRRATITGEVRFRGRSILGLPEKELDRRSGASASPWCSRTRWPR